MTAIRLQLAVTLAILFSVAVRADDTVRVEAQHAQATPGASEPNVARFNLTFDLRLTNGSAKPVNIPKPETGDTDKTRISVVALQSRKANGPWSNVFQASWYGIGTETYDSCVPLPPSGTAQIDGVETSIIFLRKQLASLGDEPTLRLYLLIFCQQPDGKLLTITIPTEAFSLKLPAPP